MLRQRLQDQSLEGLESRYELIGVNAIFGPALAGECANGLAGGEGQEPAEVRVRVAVRSRSKRDAERVANEVEAMYINGPYGGGGATRQVREVIAAASVLLPRELVPTHVIVKEL